ncbi:alpha-L-glutamate ligase [Novosphingobium marinum]|uniref:Gamma-F420-2:alpha-L-glutamate ligase n=1 Tax=Novosphingobium marinum TaxID=1514948 RepID=A0A7Y9XW78_9SPHN|nr:RimK family alpha-L-glutamate ligase [Novosphingobium marinum]NYH95605.1 gamma-F420-2:alpha-L-glutamate ligase [Novosphingobium marinum]GGC28389.1 alpha-L-glutamate ligase [Novosphingobium marinum]
MKVWILYKDCAAGLKPEAYEINRFIEIGGRKGHEIEVFRPEQFELLVTADSARSVMVDAAVAPLPDVLLPRMGAGTTYFALSVIRQLERLRVPTFNTSLSIETVRDKLYTHQLLSRAKLPIPKTMLAKFPIDVSLVERALGFPVVVKTLSGSQGSGVFLCETRQNFEDLMELVRATQSNANLIFQEFIADSRGRDIRMLVIGGRVVAAMERQATNGSFKANFSIGGEVKPFKPDRDAEWLALESARLLGLDIAGIDLLFDGDGYKICEANSSPGFEGIESCCEANIAAEILDFVSFRL